MAVEGVAALKFCYHPPSLQVALVLGHAVGLARHLEETIANRPLGLVQFARKYSSASPDTTYWDKMKNLNPRPFMEGP